MPLVFISKLFALRRIDSVFLHHGKNHIPPSLVETQAYIKMFISSCLFFLFTSLLHVG
jgi:hypothetical protein